MVSRWPLHRRVSCGGCSRVEHRLVGAVISCRLTSTGLLRSLGRAGRGPWVGVGWGCLARCWVLRGRRRELLSFMTVAVTGARGLLL